MYTCLSVPHICKNVKNEIIVKFHIYVLSLILSIAIALCITVSLVASMKTKDLKSLMFYSKKKNHISPLKKDLVLFCSVGATCVLHMLTGTVLITHWLLFVVVMILFCGLLPPIQNSLVMYFVG